MPGRFFACALLVLAIVLVLSAASAPAALQKRGDCTGGASSVRAEMVNGRIVTSTPVETGCIPR